MQQKDDWRIARAFIAEMDGQGAAKINELRGRATIFGAHRYRISVRRPEGDTGTHNHQKNNDNQPFQGAFHRFTI
jgi:hypothetical protein